MKTTRLKKTKPVSQSPGTTIADDSPKTCSPGVATFRPSSKIRDRHRERLAIVYVRQSSPHQVLENRESRERQYALAKLAEHLGWSSDRVMIIDEDQGVSGKSSTNRSGFQRLLSEVSLNHVGLVLALELNRLSRSSTDWHHLVEVCAVFNTLLGDQDGIYDGADSNDRLLLGMKGAMGEFELITLRNRLERGRDNKAARGDLFLQVPIGYTKASSGEVILEPDEQARSVVQLVFAKFAELGTVWGVFRYLLRNKIQLGFRCLRGPNRGHLEWRRPNSNRILAILRHPIYAGAYTYGLHRPCRKNPVSGRSEKGKWFLSPDEVGILIQDRVPAYISWEQYLTNQRRISENRSIPNAQGVPRRGEALLSGLLICGSCGHHMNVSYFAKQTKKPHYWCDSHLHDERKQPCYGLKAPPVDELVTQQVLRALEPATIGLSIQTAMDIERERDRLHQHWRQRVERARYNSQRAERQYQCVEPENRLVARTVEQQWEEALRQERQLREEYARFAAETPASLSASDQQRIRAAAESVSRLWLAPETKPEDRKEIIRCLIERVVVHHQPNSEYVDTTIHWRGGFTSQHQVVRPVGRYTQLRDYDLLVERIKTLHREGNSLPAIADKLNTEGFTPPRRRGNFSRYTLNAMMSSLGLVGELRREGILGPDEWWVPNLATRLEMSVPKIYYWIKQEWVHSRRTSAERHWIVWADDEELKRLEELRGQHNSYTAQRNPKLVTPKVRKA